MDRWEVLVELSSNSGGGYIWTIESMDSNVQLTREESIADVFNLVGSHARMLFYFSVHGNKGEVTFSHKRPWSGEELERRTIVLAK